METFFSPIINGTMLKNVAITKGNTANHRIVLLKLKCFNAVQTGYWIKGLVIVAKLICQAKVEGVQSGPKANKAELAIGFQLKNIELCKNAKPQNSIKSIHLWLDPKKNQKHGEEIKIKHLHTKQNFKKLASAITDFSDLSQPSHKFSSSEGVVQRAE